jgi:putative lipoprotein
MYVRETFHSVFSKLCRALVTILLLNSSDAISADATLAGIASYRERMPLPANTAFEATLEDISRADAPAIVLGRARIEAPQRVPINFTNPYDAARIDARNRYAVRARVLLGEQLLFTTDSIHAVDFSQRTPIEVTLRRTGTETTSDASPATTVALENTIWRLTILGRQSIVVMETKLEPFIRLQAEDKRLIGFGGCNQMTGSYAVNGDKLSFSQVAVTMMACQRGMEIEGAFNAMLGKVTRWRINEQRLELLDSAGATLAQFEQRIVN